MTTQNIQYTQCPCCGSFRISRSLTAKDFTVSGEEFEIWECGDCTLRFTQNVPNAASIWPYYQSAAYVSHSDTREGLINRLYHFVREYTLKSKIKLVCAATQLRKGKLLDVGAGTGAFANAMSKAGWEVTGLEPDETARKNAEAKYTLVLQSSETLYSLDEEQFDAITMWHVLEHVHDLQGYLEKFHGVLKQNGKLIIAVPNYTSYDAKLYHDSWAAYDVPRHLYHFSPHSMETLAAFKGFTVKDFRPMWFDSFYVCMLSEKYKYGRGNMMAAFLNGLVSNIKAMRNNKKCSSVIYVLEKNS